MTTASTFSRPFLPRPSSGEHSPQPAHQPGTLPRTGVVLLGTARTVATLAQQVGRLDPAPVIAGAILFDPTPGSRPLELSVPLLGTPDELPLLVERFKLRMAVVCIPAADIAARKRAESLLAKAELAAKWVPTLEELLGITGADARSGVVTTLAPKEERPGHRFVGSMPQIDLGELIGREPHAMDRDAIARVITGKRVLITGAGGSIGSELARVAAGFDPSLLVLMERSENSLFEIDRQMARLFPRIPRKAVLHDVVEVEATLRLATDLRPHVVFHAAAHKHVPLMEDHPSHALTNNLFGTKSIADASVACGAERFVMISSDKAVNPTSVMGATKRLAELYVHGLGADAGNTRLSMVRFGNVLGSAASVLTIWSQQLTEGGPVTITDPRMTRYFMTIPEAATLVVQSTTLRPAGKSENGVGVFVLDMGKPVRIAELTARFVRAHGLTPRLRLDRCVNLDCAQVTELASIFPEPDGGWDASSGQTIDVVVTGARPGEKLHEELAYAAEALRKTSHPGVQAWAGPGFTLDHASGVRRMIAELAAARSNPDRYAVLSAIRKHVPEMRPADPPASQTIHPNVG